MHNYTKSLTLKVNISNNSQFGLLLVNLPFDCKSTRLDSYLTAVKHHHAEGVFAAGKGGRGIHFWGNNDRLCLVPERVLTEDKIGQVLRETSSLQDLNLFERHK